MSKINIQGIVDDIKSQASVYTPLLEAVVNSIQAIEEGKVKSGKIRILFERENTLNFGDDAKAAIKNIYVIDNGIGFVQTHRDSFDTFKSDMRRDIGGKGFGRFMFLKFFDSVKIESVYNKNGTGYWERKFNFGRKYDIIENETEVEIKSQPKENETKISLIALKEKHNYDKQLDTIARKLLEHLLIYFVDEKYTCPEIWLEEKDGSEIFLLNDFLNKRKEIQLVKSDSFNIKAGDQIESFNVKIFKIFFTPKTSRISLAAQNREVSETPIYNYIPEFVEDFYEISGTGENQIKRNYIIKAYVLGQYLTDNVSTERDTFNFDKDESNAFYAISQKDIESKTADVLRNFFKDEVRVRSEKKKEQIMRHVNERAPWHKLYIDDIDLSLFPFNAEPEKIESELQKFKFEQETKTRDEVNIILQDDSLDYKNKLEGVLAKITQIGRSDLAHYVSNRSVILSILEKLLERDPSGDAKYEEKLHNLIFPMGKGSHDTSYEEHNLWLLDERFVFSDFVASDRKIGKKKSPTEPDLVVFDKRRAFRQGDNEFSNPITIFEFKRPKRVKYGPDEDPIVQLGNYFDQIKAGKYETPKGVEKIKANENTPAYGYVVCDLCPKIHEFAKHHSLTICPDSEGYFGFHVGFKMYIEMFSYKKLRSDATLRNKIFFKKLGLV